jgi:hypothetical protein
MALALMAMLVQESGIEWRKDHAGGLAKAKAEKKLAIVHFQADW